MQEGPKHGTFKLYKTPMPVLLLRAHPFLFPTPLNPTPFPAAVHSSCQSPSTLTIHSRDWIACLPSLPSSLVLVERRDFVYGH